jgi:hypothetical protein
MRITSGNLLDEKGARAGLVAEEEIFLRSERLKAGAWRSNRLTFRARRAKLGALQVR